MVTLYHAPLCIAFMQRLLRSHHLHTVFPKKCLVGLSSLQIVSEANTGFVRYGNSSTRKAMLTKLAKSAANYRERVASQWILRKTKVERSDCSIDGCDLKILDSTISNKLAVRDGFNDTYSILSCSGELNG
ncbi:hypothetical protein OK016_02320 [Vibrio chagasii]|nr:hypothetical protein [Vibrio chagasii]